jgi:hypothetical protein
MKVQEHRRRSAVATPDDQISVTLLSAASCLQLADMGDMAAVGLMSASDAANEAGTRSSRTTQFICADIHSVRDGVLALGRAAYEISLAALTCAGQVSDLRRTTDSIRNIARKLNLTAVAAEFEAGRQENHSERYTIIAVAVRDLADATCIAASQMSRQMSTLSAGLDHLHIQCRDSMKSSESLDNQAGVMAERAVQLLTSTEEFTRLAQRLSDMAHPMRQMGDACRSVEHSLSAIVREATRPAPETCCIAPSAPSANPA